MKFESEKHVMYNTHLFAYTSATLRTAIDQGQSFFFLSLLRFFLALLTVHLMQKPVFEPTIEHICLLLLLTVVGRQCRGTRKVLNIQLVC